MLFNVPWQINSTAVWDINSRHLRKTQWITFGFEGNVPPDLPKCIYIRANHLWSSLTYRRSEYKVFLMKWYDDIHRMDGIKSLSFHIMFYRLFHGVAKYIVYGNTFSSFEWLRSLHAAHHGAWRGDRSRMRTTSQDKTSSSFLNEGLHL